jgi:hypothetical protein
LNQYASEDEVTQRLHHQLICRKAIEDAVGLVYTSIGQEK